MYGATAGASAEEDGADADTGCDEAPGSSGGGGGGGCLAVGGGAVVSGGGGSEPNHAEGDVVATGI